MLIRDACLDDIQSIAELHALSWQENYNTVLSAKYLDETVLIDRKRVWNSRLTNPAVNQLVLVAEIESVLCGFICSFGAKHPRLGTIVDNLHVKPDVKGQKIGSKLLSAAASWAHSNYQNHGFYLEVLECNTNAIGFYESVGAKNIGASYWHTPCGNKVKEFIYSWGSPGALVRKQF